MFTKVVESVEEEKFKIQGWEEIIYGQNSMKDTRNGSIEHSCGASLGCERVIMMFQWGRREGNEGGWFGKID